MNKDLDLSSFTIPRLYENEETPIREQIAVVRIFIPYTSICWYITEYDPVENLCYGIAHITETEFGYFSLEEIQELPYPVIIDRHFNPTQLPHILELSSFISRLLK